MTLSAEARAAAVVRDYYATDLDVINGAEGEKRTIEALIAAAIREACNEKLEEAALYCDGEANTPSSAGEKAAGRRDAGRRLSRIIRNWLKDPTP